MDFRFLSLSQGCSANVGEGEQIASLLRNLGGIPDANEPDLIVFNLCCVKGCRSALSLVKKNKSTHPRAALLATGCLSVDLRAELKRLDEKISILGANAWEMLAEAVDEILKGRCFEFPINAKHGVLNTGRIRKNPVIGIVPVSRGCLDACAFCVTRLIKGVHESYPENQILEEIRAHLQAGCREIWLTGQDAGCYGFERSSNLARLVRLILETFPDEFLLRLGMGNPRHIFSYWEELANILQDPRVFTFLHLPVQSGSDAVLQRMGRQHKTSDFLKLVEGLRQQVPDLTLSTDLIVGFPGETSQDFAATLQLLRAVHPAVINMARFVVRPGTLASRMPDRVPREEIHARSLELSLLIAEISRKQNQESVGRLEDVIVEEPGKAGDVIARTIQYRPVALHQEIPLGSRVCVKINNADTFTLHGVIV
ncbi:MAG TPA: tRNA (N(6)-L-threonylcarbamoyladenosine(37)-C(2))-methylthiotransferase [Fibrobacteraceae bacterium]|nr:tRNA (N(6)-L-threonylcarbamoyladenosine(37)-C(2))-methylthiotransferase [Fibrobacteraceae bacterium]